jgi:hypothetical protein
VDGGTWLKLGKLIATQVLAIIKDDGIARYSSAKNYSDDYSSAEDGDDEIFGAGLLKSMKKFSI